MNATITSVEAIAVHYPVSGHFKYFAAPPGRPAGRPSVVVQLATATGMTGWGQSVPSHRWSYETLESVLTTIRTYLGPALIGMDAFDTNGIHAMMARLIAPSFSMGQPICKAGIDLALHDLTGRLTGRSCGDSWERTGRDRITLSWTLNPATLADVDLAVAEAWARGYRHFNLKVAPDARFDWAVCAAVRRLAPDASLWVDANGGYDLATALAVAPRLADLGVSWFEQPVPANRLSWFRQLKKQGALPIVMDEGVVTATDLEEFIRLDALDGVAIKHSRSGGLTEARRMIQVLEESGLIVLGSGLTDPDLSLAAALQLFGRYDLRFPAALNGPQYLSASILERPFTVVDGSLEVPRGPGLGVDVNDRRLRDLQAGPNDSSG